ncbi:MAG: cupin domain-containing protein [Aeromonas molluscorum]
MDKYVLSKKEIDEYEGIQKTHFLNQNARRVNKSLGDLTGLTGFGFHIIEVEPGCETTEMHKHYHEDECVYILQGNADAYIGNEVFQVGPGDFIGYRAGGLGHSIKNTGSELLKCIVVGQRLDNDVADYTKLQKRIYRQKNMPWNLVDIPNVLEPTAGKKA